MLLLPLHVLVVVVHMNSGFSDRGLLVGLVGRGELVSPSILVSPEALRVVWIRLVVWAIHDETECLLKYYYSKI